MSLITRQFYQRETVEVAKALLGCRLVHKTPEGVVTGVIVETEAYLSSGDEACHASRGMTQRNATMFGPPGRSYVYFIYGMYFCFNVVTGSIGKGEAVLIRALEPTDGLPLMQARRNKQAVKDLCSGPGKLCTALGISAEHNNRSLYNGSLKLLAPLQPVKKSAIACGPRIGLSVAQELPLRFGIRDSKFLSRRF